jgi:ATP-binding cassette subfamily F protein 2
LCVCDNYRVHPKSRDIKIDNLSITFYGFELLQDTTLELNCGRRYGLIGLNGSGKSALLSTLGNREVPIPPHIDIYHLTREIPASDKTALQCVVEVDEERTKLELLAEELVNAGDDESQDQLMDIYERLDEMSADTAETRAASILNGLDLPKKCNKRKRKISQVDGG